MGVMDKFLNYMKLNDNDEYYDDGYEEEELETPRPRKNESSKEREADDYAQQHQPVKKPSLSSKVTPMRQPTTRKIPPSSGMGVCLIKPVSVEDTREIVDTLLDNRTVLLNLEGLDVDIAQRIIDFTSGACYAISGNLQKVSHYVFLVTPASVDISGDFQDILNGRVEAPLNNGL
ncbi:MAG: cell division protein SepF [Clostridium sp.]|jgi:cell division inhibitor SepF|nr:cell division protein SepF [Clostridium sp.]